MRTKSRHNVFTAFAIVVEAMKSEASASLRLLDQTVGICLASEASAPHPFKFINELANQESASMFARNITKQAALGVAVFCMMIFGAIAWPTVGRLALAQGEDSEVIIEPVRSSSQTENTARTANLQSPPARQEPENISNVERIRRPLQVNTDVQFVDVPLSEVLKKLGEQHGIQVVLEESGLAAEGVTPDIAISIDVEGIGLSDALKLILRPMRLAAVVTEGVLLVTSRQNADQYTTTTVVYPIDERMRNIESEKESSQKKVSGTNGTVAT